MNSQNDSYIRGLIGKALKVNQESDFFNTNYSYNNLTIQLIILICFVLVERQQLN